MSITLLRLFSALALVASSLCSGMGPAHAGMLAHGQVLRSIPFVPRDGLKPVIPAQAEGKEGFLMPDNGTPDALFLNKDAIALKDGHFAAQAHRAPALRIDGVPVAPTDTVRSGNFLFSVAALRPGVPRFMGTKMPANEAPVLDYDRRLVSIIRVDAGRKLSIAPPLSGDVG